MRRVDRAIQLTKGSLESHIESIQMIVSGELNPDDLWVGDINFHLQCIKEYAFVIEVLKEYR